MNTKIISGSDKARELGFPSYRKFLEYLVQQVRKTCTWKVSRKERIYARIDFGRWIADCECGSAAYVDPDDPVFFCTSCGNAVVSGDLRKVIFPEEREEIEAELMQREVFEKPGLKGSEAALASVSMNGLSRSWRPGESVQQLKEQRANHGI